ncbi:MAG TPA: type II toxin-antitoxin system PemK/MazF family toxin [Acidimicrobiales bacterium]|nr:type II toxin-antitoxin system PemK/MazF family toxin [Acidimicrobiales bacterium]
MASTDTPGRREIWLVALGAGQAGEPAKTRPGVVVSRNELSTGAPSDLIVVVPLSSSAAPSGLRVEVAPIAGIDRPSLAMCRAVRSVVSSRFVRRIGMVDPVAMENIEAALALILGLDDRSVPG